MSPKILEQLGEPTCHEVLFNEPPTHPSMLAHSNAIDPKPIVTRTRPNYGLFAMTVFSWVLLFNAHDLLTTVAAAVAWLVVAMWFLVALGRTK